jgi:hypothetical protein
MIIAFALDLEPVFLPPTSTIRRTAGTSALCYPPAGIIGAAGLRRTRVPSAASSHKPPDSDDRRCTIDTGNLNIFRSMHACAD